MNANATVTWKTADGRTATVTNWPADSTHTVYAADTHTATVVHLADTPQQAPAIAPAAVGGSTIALSSATLVGLGLVLYMAIKWKTVGKDIKRAWAVGASAAVLVGSFGIFGTFTNVVKSGAETAGTSIVNVTSGNGTR